MKAKHLATLFGGLVGALTICATAYSQATRTWDGGGVGSTTMDTAANWSGDTVPTGAAPGDTAQWDGTVAGDLSLTYAPTASTAPLATGNGIHLNITSGQTGALTINQSNTANALRLQNITIASGAGAFTLGGDGVLNNMTWGAGGVDTFTWTNNSANTATVHPDVNFAFGGGDDDNNLTFTGSGNWLFNGHFGNNGTGSLNSTSKSGAGTLTITSDTTGTNSGAVQQGAGQVFVKAGAIVIDTGGVLRALSSNGGDFASIGQNGTDVGTMTVKGSGSFIVNGDLNVGDIGSSQGTLNIQDSATVTVAINGFFVGSANAAASTASGIVNHSGGTLQKNAAGDAFVIGGRIAGATGSGTYNLSGGTVNNAGTASIGSFGTGTVNHTAGDWNNMGAVFIGRQTGSTGTYHLNGGTLTAAGVNGGTGTSTFNFNGGTLKANANSATFMNGLTTANVRNGGAVIDTNNFNVTASQALVHSTIGGDNAIDGGLNKTGAGTLTLAGANTYTGPTAVNNGTLAVTGSLNNSSALSVASGATLDGTGTVGATTVAVGGNVANGNGGTGTLTLSSLTFSGAATVNARVGGTVPISASTLVTNPGSGQVTINGSGVWANGNNNLIAFGIYGGALSHFSLGTVNGLNIRQTVDGLVMNGNNVALSVTGDNPKWTGLDNSNWVIGATGANKNWRLVTATTSTDYIDGDAVLFDDTATGLAVDITAGNVNPTSVTFNNSTKNFTIAGSGGGIAGTTGLTKNGSGSVSISASNSYSGLTTINAGTLTLSGTNSTTAGTAFNGGTLNVDNASALGTGALTIGTGGVKTLGNTSGAAVLATGDIAQTWNDDFTFSGTVDGTHDLDMGQGAVTVAGAGDRTVTVSNGTLTVGEMRTSQGFVKQGAGTLILTSTGNSGNGAGTDGSVITGPLNVVAGTVQFNRTEATTTGDFTVGGLTGSGRIVNGAASERWIHMNNSGNFNFSGTLENGGTGILGFYKTGAGTQTLSGNNTFTGPLTVNAGTLTLGGTNAHSGITTVADGTLNFTGTGSLANSSEYRIGNGAGVLQIDSSSRIGGNLINITSSGAAPGPGAGSTGRLELSGNTILANPITLAQRSDTNGSDAIRSVSGNNSLNGLITITTGGNQARIRSDAGQLTLGGGVTTTATSGRDLYLQGAGNGNVTGIISNNSGDPVNGLIRVHKEGSGTWALSNANTYTGGTTIDGGTLLVNNTTGSGTGTGGVTVANGGTLAGTGVIDTSSTNANVTVAASGSISPGTSAGTLTFALGTGQLDLSAVTGGGLKFELGAPATPGASDQVKINSGTLNLGALDFSDFTFTNAGGAAVGTYKLFDAASPMAVSLNTASGSFAGLAATLSLDTTNFDVLLNITGPAGTPGDYNNNGIVDAADYAVWRKNLGTNTVLPNDPTGGTIGTAQYDTWKAHFGQPPGSGSAAGQASLVPEPTTGVLFLCGMMVAGALRYKRERKSHTIRKN